ncbi:MAG: hypothetical protein HYY16_02480 [Planctomycetes bacterium]|nr:hypothetical protein [Planctomycetota bacterium]
MRIPQTKVVLTGWLLCLLAAPLWGAVPQSADEAAQPLDLDRVHYAYGEEIQLSFELEGKSEAIFAYYGPAGGKLEASPFRTTDLSWGINPSAREVLRDRPTPEQLVERITWDDLTLEGRDEYLRELFANRQAVEGDQATLPTLYLRDASLQGLSKELRWERGGPLTVWEISVDGYVTKPAELFSLLETASRKLQSDWVHIHVSFKPNGLRNAGEIAGYIHVLDSALHAEGLERGSDGLTNGLLRPFTPPEVDRAVKILAGLQGSADEKWHLIGVRAGRKLYLTADGQPAGRVGFEVRGAYSMQQAEDIAVRLVQNLESGRWDGAGDPNRPMEFSLERLDEAMRAKLKEMFKSPEDAYPIGELLAKAKDSRNGRRLDYRVATPMADWESLVPSEHQKARIREAREWFVDMVTTISVQARRDAKGPLTGEGNRPFEYGDLLTYAVYKWAEQANISPHLYKRIGLGGDRRNESWLARTMGRAYAPAPDGVSLPMPVVRSGGDTRTRLSEAIPWNVRAESFLSSWLYRAFLAPVIRADAAKDVRLRAALDLLEQSGETGMVQALRQGKARVFWFGSPEFPENPFTVGRDIYIHRSEAAPETAELARTLRHEWEHVKGGSEMQAYRAQVAWAQVAGVPPKNFRPEEIESLDDKQLRRLIEERYPGYKGKRGVYSSDAHWLAARGFGAIRGPAGFGAAWILKETFRAAETLDAKRFRASVSEVRKPEFWKTFGIFSAGSWSADRVLHLALGNRIAGPGFGKSTVRSALSLAAGTTAVDLASHNFSWTNVGLSTGSYLMSGAAVRAITAKPGAWLALRLVRGTGPQALMIGAIEIVNQALTLYGGERLQELSYGWMNRGSVNLPARDGVLQRVDHLGD